MVASVCLVAAYALSVESYLYLTRSDEKAQGVAQQMFEETCREEALDPASFRGPDRPNGLAVDQEIGQYIFRWVRPPHDDILVGISYLPYDVSVSGHWQPAAHKLSPRQ